MSYITNLVHRTLGVGPFAQPVIQAKFAPHSQAVASAGHDVSASQTTSASTQIAKPVATPQNIHSAPLRLIDPQPDSAETRKERRAHDGQLPGLLNPAQPDQPIDEWQPVPPSVWQLERAGEIARDVRGLSGTAQGPEASSLIQNPTRTGDEFHLMQNSPPPLLPSGSNPYQQTIPRSKEIESVEPPVVRIHIGRVDVRMVTPGAKEPRPAASTFPDAKPVSLEEYLQSRQRGHR